MNQSMNDDLQSPVDPGITSGRYQTSRSWIDLQSIPEQLQVDPRPVAPGLTSSRSQNNFRSIPDQSLLDRPPVDHRTTSGRSQTSRAWIDLPSILANRVKVCHPVGWLGNNAILKPIATVISIKPSSLIVWSTTGGSQSLLTR